MKLKLDVDALTFGDMEDFEDVTGVPLMETVTSFADADGDADASKLRPKDMIALIWIIGRHDNPDFTLEEARKVPIAEIEFEGTAPDPTGGSES